MAKPIRAVELHYPMIQFLKLLFTPLVTVVGKFVHLKTALYLSCAINFGTVVIKGDFFKTREEFKRDISYTRYSAPPSASINDKKNIING